MIGPEKVKGDMEQNTLYLPLPYSRSSIYLAYEVVMASGDIGSIKGNSIKQLLKTLYEIMLDEEISDSELDKLFKKPWEIILPKVSTLSQSLNLLRTAITQIEEAA